jgi:hypothetical protein
MPIAYDDIIDFQYNPFTEQLTPKLIGWDGNPTEDHVIDSNGYGKLYGYPQENVPSTTRCFINSVEFQEVPATVTPSLNQFSVWYDEIGLGWFRFNPAQAGETANFWYYNLGTIHQKTTLDSRVPSSGNTTINGEKTFSGDVIVQGSLKSDQKVDYYDSSLAVSQKILKKIILEIGLWNTTTTPILDIDLSSIIPDNSVITNIFAVINTDSGGQFPLFYADTTGFKGGSVIQTMTVLNKIIIRIARQTSGVIDGLTAAINRGFVSIEYFEA